ncbi:poly(glycerol-phosphate) alpha-glucosyltransferase [Cellulomonas sp. PhB143]|nr:poly(glycerol-phosphate) alpha-glucosyltransferase [Cellulomonas sp. PhB143]
MRQNGALESVGGHLRRAGVGLARVASQGSTGPVYVATFRLPESFGGVTHAMLQHTRMFARTTSGPVALLTFEHGLDVSERRRQLRSAGLLDSRTELRNLWAELREAPRAPWAKGHVLPDLPPVPAHHAATTERAGDGSTVTYEDTAGVVARDHLRADGTVVVRDVLENGRRVSFSYADREGSVREVRGLRRLRRLWLDHVVQAPATLVVESKGLLTAVGMTHPPGVRKIFVVHGSHLLAGAADAHGPLDPKRSSFVDHLDDFDRIVFLTHAQLRDVGSRYGHRKSFTVLPNARDTTRVRAERDRRRGVVVARLVAAKGVDAAMRATGTAARDAGHHLLLDILGDGPQRSSLEQVAHTLDHVDVRMLGHVTDVPRRFASASFSVLASSTEGHPLVLVESMAQGCVPIAYDVRYGPSEIIEDGISGFLVPSGDESALARAIACIVAMEPQRLESMRAAARRRADAFSERVVRRRWRDLVRN